MENYQFEKAIDALQLYPQIFTKLKKDFVANKDKILINDNFFELAATKGDWKPKKEASFNKKFVLRNGEVFARKSVK